MPTKRVVPEIEAEVKEPTFIRRDERGLFVEVVNEGPWETVIHGSMRKGAHLGNHYHRECRAFFYLLSGRAEVKIRLIFNEESVTTELGCMEGVVLRPYETHMIRFLEDSDFLLLKSYRYRDEEPDIFPYDVEA